MPSIYDVIQAYNVLCFDVILVLVDVVMYYPVHDKDTVLAKTASRNLV